MGLKLECGMPGCDEPAVGYARARPRLRPIAVCAELIYDGRCTNRQPHDSVGEIGYRLEHGHSVQTTDGRPAVNFGGDASALCDQLNQAPTKEWGLVLAEWSWESAHRWRRRILCWEEGREEPAWSAASLPALRDWSREAIFQAGRLLDNEHGPRRGRPRKLN